MKNLFFALTTILFLTTSCQKQPEACFTMSGDKVAGKTITFTNCSVDGDHFEWNLGDGTILNGSEASHEFAAPGTYSVQLKAFSKNEKKESVTVQSVTIEQARGNVTFWAGPATFSQYIVVSLTEGLNNAGSAEITQAFTGQITCNAANQANFNLEIGEYAFFASSPSGFFEQGVITVTADGCLKHELQ